MKHTLFITDSPATFKAATVVTQNILGRYTTKYKHCCGLSTEHTISVTRVPMKSVRILFLLGIA